MKTTNIALLVLSFGAAEAQSKLALEQLETASGALAAQNDQLLGIVARYHMAKVWLAAGETQKAKESLDFAAASISPDLGAVEARRQFLQFQAEVVGTAVSVDPEHGVEMIHAMPAEIRTGPVWQLIRYYQKGNVDKAVDIAQQFCLEGVCPYPGLQSLMKQLPADDDRRVQLYYNAAQSYRTNGNFQFIDFFKSVWPDIPKETARQDLDYVVSTILNRKDDHDYQQVFSSAAGTAILNNRIDADLFKLIPALRALAPKRLDDILDQRIGLKSAVGRFSDGLQTLEKAGSVDYSIGGGSGPGADAGRAMISREASHSALAKAMAEIDKNPDSALDAADSIADPTDRIRLLSAIAQRGGRTHLLSRCLDLAKDLPASGELVNSMLAVAKSAKEIKNESVIRAALDRALAASKDLRKQDGDPDHPNLAIIEYWPSAQAYRRTVVTALDVEGPDGLWVLDRISDGDMSVLARIAAAQTLMGNPPTGSVTYWTYAKK